MSVYYWSLTALFSFGAVSILFSLPRSLTPMLKGQCALICKWRMKQWNDLILEKHRLQKEPKTSVCPSSPAEYLVREQAKVRQPQDFCCAQGTVGCLERQKWPVQSKRLNPPKLQCALHRSGPVLICSTSHPPVALVSWPSASQLTQGHFWPPVGL